MCRAGYVPFAMCRVDPAPTKCGTGNMEYKDLDLANRGKKKNKQFISGEQGNRPPPPPPHPK